MVDGHYILSYIGVQGPFLLVVLSIILLFNQQNYLKFFFVGLIVNTILNVILKIIIKDPRPSDDRKALEIGVINGRRISFDKYGMPSGHAQMVMYLLIYITMVLNSPEVSCLFGIISINSIYQRFANNNHTILQLIVGMILGCVVGYISYIKATTHIKGDIKPKKDDNAPK